MDTLKLVEQPVAIETEVRPVHNQSGFQVVERTISPLPDQILLREIEFANLHDRALDFLLSVTAEEGTMYASEDPRFHHEFGRDIMIAAFFIASAARFEPTTERGEKFRTLWQRTKKAVFNFWTNHQLPNGQLPHEVKPFNEMDSENPFFHKVGNMLVNDDSVDATALGLMVLPRLIETEEEFAMFEPRVRKAIEWMTDNMDTAGYNYWLSYTYNDHNGGHISQGILDAHDVITYGIASSIKDRPVAPIALVDVQGYAWKALRVWADILKDETLRERADDMKRRFNQQFVVTDKKGTYLARALDGNGESLRSVTVEPGMALWASYNGESIIDKKYTPSIIQRLLSPDMFDDTAGIRVFENGQETYNDHEWYQTGDNQYWPIMTMMAASGMYELGYTDEAIRVMRANMIALREYGSFVEHFIKNGVYLPLFEKSENSVNQTWTAASFLYATALLLASNAFLQKEVAAV